MNRFILTITLFLVCVWLPANCRGQDGLDVVVVKRHDKPGETLERRGVIHSWRGPELEMETSGTNRRIANEDIVEVRTMWPTVWTGAEQSINERQFAAVVEPLNAALAEETRAWAQTILRDKLVRIYDLLGQPESAAEQFLLIIAEDPETRFFPSIPLAWQTASVSPRMEQASQKWMATNIPTLRLLGASWLLGTPNRNDAIRVLTELSQDIDPKIAHIASGQLWRTEWISIDAPTLVRWEQQIERMPSKLQAGPLIQLAAAQDRLDQRDQAIISLLKNPILHPENLSQSRASLVMAAGLLSKQDKEQDASRIRAELAADFPGLGQ